MLERIGRLITEAAEDRKKRVLFVIVLFIVLGSADYLVEWALTVAQLKLIAHGTIDGIIVGGIAAVLSWFLFEAARRERARLRAELEEEARLNHEIRNALEVIGQAGYMIQDRTLKNVVSDSVKRIDTILRRHTPPENHGTKPD